MKAMVLLAGAVSELQIERHLSFNTELFESPFDYVGKVVGGPSRSGQSCLSGVVVQSNTHRLCVGL
ncbi:hypothetical protein D3C84_711130 [compost metagenome]